MKPVKPAPSESSSSISETSSTGTQESVPPPGSIPSVSDGGLVPRVSPVQAIDSGNGSLQGVAVREEYQHQMYRRSIEPGAIQADQDVFLAQKPPPMLSERDFRHEAEYFFQNSLISGRTIPNSVYTSIPDNKTRGGISEEKYLSLVSGANGPSSPHKVRPWAEGPPVGQHIDRMVVSDCVSALRPSKSSLEMSQYSKPNVFHPSHSTNDLAAMSSFSPKKFAFDKLQKMSPIPSHHTKHTDSFTSDPVRHMTFRTGELESEFRPSPSKVNPQESVSIATGISGIKYLERDCHEIPRYREVIQTGEHRDMVAFPRHIERTTFSDIQNGEARPRAERQWLTGDDDRSGSATIPIISRADSVGKGPFLS